MENKTPNYKMIPGSREKDTPGNFRDTPANKYMAAPSNMGHDTVANMGHSPMDKHEPGHEEKKDKGIKLAVQTSKGPKAPRGPQSGKIGGVRVSIQTKGRSTKNTDLLEEGKKAYRKIKSYFSS